MLAHLLNRFYMVTKFILHSLGDLNFLDNKNMHGTESKKHMLHLMTFCKKIEPFVLYYNRLIKLYNMAHNILENEIDLILPVTLPSSYL